ncbi:MAG: HEAT repeat domain-containing protein [Armatimonadetes bacterium]|nr:HEAT repeat domain-containing protein [Armatimonadota bacterium]
MKVRLVAITAVCLALAGCQKSGPTQALLTSTDPAQRAAAATALSGTNPAAKNAKEIVTALAMATADTDKTVRKAAIQALAKVGGPDARQALLDVVRGRQYTRAALEQYKAIADKHPDVPEVLAGLAKAQTDLAQYAEAEKSLDSLNRIADALDPQQAGRFMNDLRMGYENLRMVYQRTNDKVGAERVGKAADAVSAKLQAMPQGGGMGGMFGGPGGGMPGGIQLQP